MFSPLRTFISPTFIPNENNILLPFVTVSEDPPQLESTRSKYIRFEIVEFTEKFASLGLISQDCKKKIKEYFKQTIVGIGRDQPTTDDELFRTLLLLTKTIYEKKKEAELKGKPLLILLGEDHSSRDALVLELMAIAIARELNVSTFLCEQDEAQTSEFFKDHEKIEKSCVEQAKLENWIFVDHFAMSNRMKFIPVDPHYSKAKQSRQKLAQWKPTGNHGTDFFQLFRLTKRMHRETFSTERKMGINEETLKVEEDAIGVFGSSHLNHITADPRADKYVILALNVGEGTCHCKRAQKVSLEGEGTPYGFDFVELQPKIIKLQRAARLLLLAQQAGIYPERPKITLTVESEQKFNLAKLTTLMLIYGIGLAVGMTAVAKSRKYYRTKINKTAHGHTHGHGL